MLKLRPFDMLVGVVSGAVAVGAQFADPEVISAIAAVVWRAEDLLGLPDWVSWLVFVVLIMSALGTIRKALVERGSR